MAGPTPCRKIISSLHADLNALLGMYAIVKTDPNQTDTLKEIKGEILRLYSEIALRKPVGHIAG
jgi:hypothetical protein